MERLFAICGFARNRTWIWSFGNSYTIHCTTKPQEERKGIIFLHRIAEKLQYFYRHKIDGVKKQFSFILFLATLSVVSGVLLSKMSLLARTGISVFKKKYALYAFMKTWWQGAFLFFGVLMFLLIVQRKLQQSMSVRNGIMLQIACIFLALMGLFYTYNDFRSDLTHRWAGERLHLGFYLFWLGWVSVSLFLLVQKKTMPLKDLGKKDTSAE